jgi:DNA-binding MarR family transcriptional regulator
MLSIISDDYAALSSLAAAMRPFQDAAKDTKVVASVALLQAFLAVAMKPGQTNSDLAKVAGVTGGGMSKMLSDLSPIGRAGDPGLGLIEQRIHPFDRRHTTNRLSIKGRALVRQITGALAPKLAREAA